MSSDYLAGGETVRLNGREAGWMAEDAGGEGIRERGELKREFLHALVTAHGPKLVRYFTRKVSDPADAHDLVQEVYMRLLKLERADLIRSPQAYVYRVAANIAREHWLKQAARPRHVPVEEPAESTRSDVEAYETSTPEDHASTLERLGQLALMLDELSPKVSAALIWAHRDGHTYEEISVRLSVPIHRVKKYLARALRHCRKNGTEE